MKTAILSGTVSKINRNIGLTNLKFNSQNGNKAKLFFYLFLIFLLPHLDYLIQLPRSVGLLWPREEVYLPKGTQHHREGWANVPGAHHALPLREALQFWKNLGSIKMVLPEPVEHCGLVWGLCGF